MLVAVDVSGKFCRAWVIGVLMPFCRGVGGRGRGPAARGGHGRGMHSLGCLTFIQCGISTY